ncbi:MAG: four helix bundle protein [Candidatus Levybacteria bacterium]|nr:four helix bundle protein [Candidatus Levybacteria bacterium]
MNTFRFLEFPVYVDAKIYYREIMLLTSRFPKEHWEISDQMRRSALSVCLNIAEGSAKKSDKDFNRFVEHALGSINETVAALDIACNEKLITEIVFRSYVSKAESITKQLGGFSKKLRS